MSQTLYIPILRKGAITVLIENDASWHVVVAVFAAILLLLLIKQFRDERKSGQETKPSTYVGYLAIIAAITVISLRAPHWAEQITNRQIQAQVTQQTETHKTSATVAKL